MEVTFDNLLKMVDDLSPEQKRILRQHLDEDWSARFGATLAVIHANMPAGISQEEIERDVEDAVEDVRRREP
jgi:hypothetical protein